MLKRVVFVGILVAFVLVTASWLWLQSAPLARIERGGAGPPTIVLLHGYGSRAEDWLQFEDRWEFPQKTRRVFPQAPLRHPFTGLRGWWWLRLEAYVPPGQQLPDLTSAHPGGIKVAARLVREAISREQQPVILGGFSQGAMTSAEIAFQTEQDLTALILLSGTTVNEEAWAEHFAGRRRLPVFIAHGRQDRVLSFAIMERFQQRLKTFGLDVTWYPFDGGHEIPLDVVNAVSMFVRRVLPARSSSHSAQSSATGQLQSSSDNGGSLCADVAAVNRLRYGRSVGSRNAVSLQDCPRTTLVTSRSRVRVRRGATTTNDLLPWLRSKATTWSAAAPATATAE